MATTNITSVNYNGTTYPFVYAMQNGSAIPVCTESVWIHISRVVVSEDSYRGSYGTHYNRVTIVYELKMMPPSYYGFPSCDGYYFRIDDINDNPVYTENLKGMFTYKMTITTGSRTYRNVDKIPDLKDVKLYPWSKWKRVEPTDSPSVWSVTIPAVRNLQVVT